jgi:hypothetical protein
VRDPLYAILERRKNWIKLSFLLWLACYGWSFSPLGRRGCDIGRHDGAGCSIRCKSRGPGGALRTVIVWHTTWSVNSVTHIWGYRNYATPDDSHNNPVIGFIAGGEGWHNNHHADPASARHGHHWWEVDFAWWSIGLATKVSLPSPNLGAKFAPRLDFPTGTGP